MKSIDITEIDQVLRFSSVISIALKDSKSRRKGN